MFRTYRTKSERRRSSLISYIDKTKICLYLTNKKLLFKQSFRVFLGSCFYLNTSKSSFHRGNDGKSWNSLNSAWYQKWDFWFNPSGWRAADVVPWLCVSVGSWHPWVLTLLPVASAPVGGRVSNEVFLHNINIAFFVYAACQDLQHQPEPAVHGLEVRLDEDRWQAVTQQRLLHQGAQLVLLFGQELETHISGLFHSGDNK